jgi:RNA polymerase sigma factor for flagellar operon FliA
MKKQVCDQHVTDLWERWGEGDLDSRDHLICHYLPLVDFIARRLMHCIPISIRGDVHSFGVIGLMDAIDKFRPELGNRFETYGSCRIRGAMSDGMRSLDWLPRGASTRASRVIEKVVPVDFQTARTAVGARLQDSLADPAEVTPLDDLLLEADYAEVVEAIAMLPERERLVIVQHYYGEKRLAEIGETLEVTESRVCQLHRRALRMLEESLTERLSA